MPLPKYPKTNWLAWAGIIDEVISDMPSTPPGGRKVGQRERAERRKLLETNELLRLLSGGYEVLNAPTKWPLDPEKSETIKLLQLRIAQHLHYRISVTHKIKAAFEDGLPFAAFAENSHPTVTKKRYEQLKAFGVQLSPADESAVSAHLMLGRVLIDRYVRDKWRVHLPLEIASIVGKSVSAAATEKAALTRNVDKRSPLSKAVAYERRLDPHATHTEVLHRICNDSAFRFVGNEIVYLDSAGKPNPVKFNTYKNIFSAQSPQKVAAKKRRLKLGQ